MAAQRRVNRPEPVFLAKEILLHLQREHTIDKWIADYRPIISNDYTEDFSSDIAAAFKLRFLWLAQIVQTLSDIIAAVAGGPQRRFHLQSDGVGSEFVALYMLEANRFVVHILAVVAGGL